MGYLQGYDDAMGDVLAAVRRERFRQEDLKRAGAFKFSCADIKMAASEKLAVLVEEVGEVANALLQVRKLNSSHDAKRDLKAELTQVAAVCVAWIESIEKAENQ